MVTLISQVIRHGTPGTLLHFAEVSRYSHALAKAATEPCTRNMIFLLTRVSSRWSSRRRWCTFLRFTPPIRSIEVTSSRSGMSASVWSTTESGHHTRLCIRPRTPTWVYGLLSCQEQAPISLVSLIILTTCWLDIITNHLLVLMCLKVVISTLTSITWSLLCHRSFTTVWLSMKMELHHLLLKWLMTSLNTSLILERTRHPTKRS